MTAILLDRLRSGPCLLVDLAGSINRGCAFTEALLRDMAKRGIVEEVADALGAYRWQLTDSSPLDAA